MKPLTLDPLEFGNLMHQVLEDTVTQLEITSAAGMAGASPEAIAGAATRAAENVKSRWDATQPVPPPVIWKRKLAEARELALMALSLDEEPLPGQHSWAEIPFGSGPRAEILGEEARAALPWDPTAIVSVPGTSICICGSIDRLDLSGDKKHARVTDYKSGKLRGHPPQIRGGSELQRCLYAFAVKVLIDSVPTVEARLLYPRRATQALVLDDPEGNAGKAGEISCGRLGIIQKGQDVSRPRRGRALARSGFFAAGRGKGNLSLNKAAFGDRGARRYLSALGGAIRCQKPVLLPCSLIPRHVSQRLRTMSAHCSSRPALEAGKPHSWAGRVGATGCLGRASEEDRRNHVLRRRPLPNCLSE